MSTKDKQDPTPIRLQRTVIRSLPVKLTDEELLKVGGQLAATVQEGRQADLKAQMKARLAELEGRRTNLAYTISRKEEYRDVEVDIFSDYQRGVVEDIRRDSGEVLITRVMTEHERQQQLPMEPTQT